MSRAKYDSKQILILTPKSGQPAIELKRIRPANREDWLTTQTLNPVLNKNRNDSKDFLFNTVQPINSKELGTYPKGKVIIADDINEVFTEDFDSSDLINSDRRRKSPTYSSNSKYFSSQEKRKETEEKENDKGAVDNECPSIIDSPNL